MKRVNLIRAIEEMGCILIRHGGRHDWFQNPETKISQPVSLHREIKDSLAKHFHRTFTGILSVIGILSSCVNIPVDFVKIYC